MENGETGVGSKDSFGGGEGLRRGRSEGEVGEGVESGDAEVETVFPPGDSGGEVVGGGGGDEGGGREGGGCCCLFSEGTVELGGFGAPAYVDGLVYERQKREGGKVSF